MTTTRPLPYFIDYSALYGKAEAISRAYRSGNLVFFLGAGASKAFDPKFPNWPELLRSVLADTQTERPEDRKEIDQLVDTGKYLLAAEALKYYTVADRSDRDEVIDRKVSSILTRKPDPAADPSLLLAILDFKAPIVTTNFDLILEAVLREHDLDREVPVFTYEEDREIGIRLDPTEEHSQYVFKLHGSAGKGRLILDEGDYTSLYFHVQWPRALALLRHILSTKMVVFIGYSLSDPEIMPILREATRYASSYQHIAFLREGETSKTEREVLRNHYRVDPILYQSHPELPLFILEMRNFNPREHLTLKLLSKKMDLQKNVGEILLTEGLEPDCSVILFGSFLKYGDLTADEADLDLFIISPYDMVSRKIVFGENKYLLDRRVDATVMSRFDFEDLLHQGDAFASSILVTGCAVTDPKGLFSILSRGLLPKYISDDIVRNAHERCRTRWLRLCTLKNTDRSDFRRACLQWTLSVMQLTLVQRKPPVNLLETSLLGNARYVIHEFARRFNGTDEEYFIDLLKGAKGFLVKRADDWPTIRGLVGQVNSSLTGKATAFELDLLQPKGAIATLAADAMTALYDGVSNLLKDVYDESMEDSLPGQVESDLSEVFRKSPVYPQLSTFDQLFFFELYEKIIGDANQGKPAADMMEELRKGWTS